MVALGVGVDGGGRGGGVDSPELLSEGKVKRGIEPSG